MKIVGIDGIGPEVAALFTAAGVRTTEGLLKRGGTAAGRRELSAATGIPQRRILEWVNHADLMRIRGVGVEFAQLLEQAGVNTVKELASRRPDSLHARLLEVNARRQPVRRPPSLRAVESWVKQAQSLPPAVKH